MLLALAHAVAGVAFVSWVVPFHMKKDTSYPDIGGLSLASYLVVPLDQSACNEGVALGAHLRTFACRDLA